MPDPSADDNPQAPTPAPEHSSPAPPPPRHRPAPPTGPPVAPPTPPAAGPPITPAVPAVPAGGLPPLGPPPPPAPPTHPGAAAAPARGGGGRGRRIAAPALVVALALASGTVGAVAATALDDDSPHDAVTSDALSSLDPVSQDNGNAAAADPDEPLSQAAAKVLPSVVSITATDGRQSGEGSGVIISSDGLVLTNNHVVALAAEGGQLEVTLPDGSTANASIEGRDPASDLAVIRIEGQDDLTPATFGSSDDLSVGDAVLAVGSPLGLDGSVTAGIVSAKDRAITLGEDTASSTTAVVSAIQTDAAINPGNSGGALVDNEGQVVGINTAIASLASPQMAGSQTGSIGLGFAIPIGQARDIADQLVNDGEATHAFLGVQMVDDEATAGATLAAVEPDSPAAKAGLQEGDVVTGIDDDQVDDVASLTARIRAHAPGDKVTLQVTRDGDEQEVEVTLGTFPNESS
ncbi:MAG TPA: trypsin-like peptidase domain-containing protein [Acidimicrobiales bacterium]|nr:trypsin-like peptidase domain-containing protein [Acidimicrobiales bacterium]